MTEEQTQADFHQIARERGVRSVHVAWHTEYVSASQIGWRIAELDREVRRAAVDLQTDGSARVRPPQEGGLAFVDAAPGSADILFEVFGFVRDVLASDAVRVLLTAIGLTGAIANVWGFVFKDRDPLHGVTGRQVLEILREYQALQAPPEGADPIGAPPTEADPSVIRISILVEHEDDSRSVLIVEMSR
ncbi:MAG: hypothetical protein WD402_08545 [Chloroflexota bacterium]